MSTKVVVTVEHVEFYDGHVTEKDIDLSDIIRNTDNIKAISVKTTGESLLKQSLSKITGALKAVGGV